MRAVLALACGFTAAACGSEDGIRPHAIDRIEIIGNDGSPIEAGDSRLLVTRSYDANGELVTSTPFFIWSSSNEAVAYVDNGLVSAVGRGTAIISATAGGKTGSTSVEVVVHYRSIATGDYNACDLSGGGLIWCWGRNGHFTSSTQSPVPARLTTPFRFTQVNAGGWNKCALSSTGEAYCWGPNDYGQLGNGTTGAGAEEPVAVVGGLRFKMVVTRTPVSCGITLANAAYCWGSNTFAVVDGAVPATAPTLVPGGHAFSTMDVGTMHACGITTAGDAYCWGNDEYGELGDGGPLSNLDSSAVPVLVAGGHKWQAITTGFTFTCGLTTAGAAYCWGTNGNGLGDGTPTSVATSPLAVAGGLQFDRIDAGAWHVCALTPANAAYCWGNNEYGQLGAEEPRYQGHQPIAAAVGISFSEVSAGDSDHTCGITVDRLTVYCFGSNQYTQLGRGTFGTRHPTPGIVTGQQP